MKKISLLLVAALICITNAFATDYDLWVAGTRVTSSNASNILNDGTASYNNSTKTLNLKGVNIKCADNQEAIFSKIDGLKISVSGHNEFMLNGTSNYVVGIYAQKDFTVQGVTNDALINIYGNNIDCCINAQGCKATITGGTRSLTIRCQKPLLSGLYGGYIGTYGSFVINKATVEINGTPSDGAAIHIKSLTLDDCIITEPAYAYFSEAEQAVVDKYGNILKDKLCITADVYCGIQVGNTRVTTANCNNVPVKSGHVDYNKSTNTLTLSGAEIVGDDSYGIFLQSSLKDVNVVLKGNNTITTNRSAGIGIYSEADCTFSAGGTGASLTTQSSAGNDLAYGIRGGSNTLTFDGGTYGLTVNVNNSVSTGISSENVAVKNANINITGKNTYGSMVDINTLTLTDCRITEPEGATFNAGKKAVVDKDGNIIKGTLNIKAGTVTTYDLSVAGTKVTSENCNDILNDGGSVSFDPVSRTLLLKNANIVANDCDGVESNIPYLRLEARGNNTIQFNSATEGRAAIRANDDIAVECGSKGAVLTLERAEGSAVGYGICGKEGITINGSPGMTLNIATGGAAVSGEIGYLLNVFAININITGTYTYGSIVGMSSMEILGCYISSPEGAVFNGGIGGIVDKDGNIITGAITILEGDLETYDFNVSAITVTSANCNDILKDGGKVRYDHATKTLTLNNATISCTTAPAISAKCPLNIVVIGDNILEGKDTGIFSYSSVHIQGSGDNATLTIRRRKDVTNLLSNAIVVADYSTIGIDGNALTLYLEETYASTIVSQKDKTPELSFENTTVFFEGCTVGALVSGFSHMFLVTAYIAEPEGIKYDKDTKKLVDQNGSNYTGALTIRSGSFNNYPLKINGIEVNTTNCYNILDDNASVMYDHATKTLTLNNAYLMVPENKYGIANTGIDGLKILVIGNNTIKMNAGSAWSGIYAFENNTSVVSGGSGATITIESSGEKPLQYGVCVDDCEFTMDGGDYDLTINVVDAQLSCIYSHYAPFNALNLKNVNLYCTGPNTYGTIIRAKNMNMEDCYIASPADACFSAGSQTVVDGNGKILKGDLTILAGVPSGVETIDNAQSTMHKFVRDGQIYIQKDGRTYNVLGTEVH